MAYLFGYNKKNPMAYKIKEMSYFLSLYFSRQSLE